MFPAVVFLSWKTRASLETMAEGVILDCSFRYSIAFLTLTFFNKREPCTAAHPGFLVYPASIAERVRDNPLK